uniref:J domain-containing protein n=1 Tax=viral metagenome TaxID=1070528 RepID=A0A6C0KTG0_9ZZZZ
MEKSLELLEFKSMDEVTPETLKRAFKEAVVKTHPDRGGKDGDFDNVLSAYLYLTNVVKRMSGGRDGNQTIYVEDVKQTRDTQFISELNNMMNEIFDKMDNSNHRAFNESFNAQFEKLHIKEQERGYGDWLHSVEEDTSVTDGKYGSATLKEKPSFSSNQLNQAFETNVTLGKPVPTALILHLDQMASLSGPARGTSLIQKAGHSFTSDPDSNPEYTDLHDAFTSDNTIFDKLPTYEEKPKTFDELLKERDMVYTTELDRDLEAIAAYEKQKMEEEKAHKQSVAEYFKKTASSNWALPTTIFKKENSFVKEF